MQHGKNCWSKYAYDCAQLQYTSQHKTVPITSSLIITIIIIVTVMTMLMIIIVIIIITNIKKEQITVKQLQTKTLQGHIKQSDW